MFQVGGGLLAKWREGHIRWHPHLLHALLTQILQRMLGALLFFILYTHCLEVISPHGFSYHCFADDITHSLLPQTHSCFCMDLANVWQHLSMDDSSSLSMITPSVNTKPWCNSGQPAIILCLCCKLVTIMLVSLPHQDDSGFSRSPTGQLLVPVMAIRLLIQFSKVNPHYPCIPSIGSL